MEDIYLQYMYLQQVALEAVRITHPDLQSLSWDEPIQQWKWNMLCVHSGTDYVKSR